MNILHIAATPFFSNRGCHIRIYGEIKYLQRSGHRIRLTTYHLGKNVEGINTIRSLRIPWYNKTSPGASWHKLYIDIFLLFTSVKAARSMRPAIIHAHLWEGLVIAIIVQYIFARKSKIIFDVQGGLAEETLRYSPTKNSLLIRGVTFLLTTLEKILIAFPSHILTSSRTSEEYIQKLTSKPVTYIPDGIDPEIFQEQTISLYKESTWKKLSIHEKAPVVLYTGGVVKGKGIETILESIAEVVKIYPSVIFLFVGSGDIEYYRTISEELGVQENVRFSGETSFFDLPSYLQLGTLAIDPKPTTTESSGKIYYYMAAALPILCIDSPQNRSYLGEKGFYFVDTQQLSKHIIQLLRNGTSAISYNVSNISWEDIAKKIDPIYHSELL